VSDAKPPMSPSKPKKRKWIELSLLCKKCGQQTLVGRRATVLSNGVAGIETKCRLCGDIQRLLADKGKLTPVPDSAFVARRI